MSESDARPTVLVFDVNETLLDITVLEPVFEHLFGDARVMRAWFAELVLYAEALTLAGRYVPFGDLGVGVLRMVAAIRGVELAEDDVARFRGAVGALPAHADAAPALERLAAAGFRLVTLTNSTAEAQTAALERTGLAAWFERTFSVEEVERFKPAPDTYHRVADALGVPTSSLALVAAHLWDTQGAQAVGAAGVFVARSGNALLPVEGLPPPDVVAPDLAAASSAMIDRWR